MKIVLCSIVLCSMPIQKCESLLQFISVLILALEYKAVHILMASQVLNVLHGEC